MTGEIKINATDGRLETVASLEKVSISDKLAVMHTMCKLLQLDTQDLSVFCIMEAMGAFNDAENTSAVSVVNVEELKRQLRQEGGN